MSDLRQAAQMAREALLEIDLLTSAVGDDEYLNDLVQKPLAALTSALEADGWRGIETAPKDKTHFLVWDAHYGTRIGKVHIRADHDDWLSYVDAHGNSSKGGIRATHWHPLPLPPPPQGEK